MGRIVETLWDCPYCDSKGILGRERKCPNCGRTRSEYTKFYLPDEITYVKEPVSKNPDWFCPYCNSYNPDGLDVCKDCGASREKAKNYFEVLNERGETPDLKNIKKERSERSYDSDNTDESNYLKENENSYYSENVNAEEVDSNKKESTYYRETDRSHSKKKLPRWFKKAAIIGGVALLLVATLLVIFIPKTKTLTVTETLWARSVDIEENRIVEESDWSVPNDAIEVLRSGQEIHHYNQVLDHYETVTEQKSRQVLDGYDVTYTYRDLGNGYAEQVEHKTPRYRTEYYTETHQEPVYKQVPVYETKYYYTVWRYVYDHTEKISGSSTTTSKNEPVWPTYTLNDKQREGKRTEQYSIKATDSKGNTDDYKVDYDLWSQLEPGKTYKFKTSLGKITSITE